MPSSRCVFNTATALRRVFMPSNVGSSHSLHLTRIFVPALLALPQQARAYWAGRDSGARQEPSNPSSSIFDRDSGARQAPSNPSSSIFDRNSYARPGSAPNSNIRRVARPYQKKVVDPDAPGPRVASKLGRMPRDNEINWPYVYVKTPGVEHWEPHDLPRPTKEVLAELDRKTTYLEAIAMPNLDEVDSPRWPVCRIVNKMEELAKLKDIKERKKKGAVKEKELELNWTLAPHDLEHKLKTLQKFLGKGYKVQVLLQKKSNGKAKAKATAEDAKALVEKVTKAIEEVKGTKEWKGREGQVLESYRIFLHGKVQDKAAPTTAHVARETPTTRSDTAEAVPEEVPAASSDAAEEVPEEVPAASSDAAEESVRSSTGTQSKV